MVSKPFSKVSKSKVVRRRPEDRLARPTMPSYDPMEFATEAAVRLNAVLTPLPIELVAMMQTVMISAIMTPYSTAAFPDSDAKNRRSFAIKRFIS
jgi:hypothetical protein